MSEVKKIATRDSYGAALVELAKDHPDVVVLDADLAAATKSAWQSMQPLSAASGYLRIFTRRCSARWPTR